MPEENVLPKMKPMVFAEHHPAVLAIDPHFFPYRFLLVCASGNSRRHRNLDTCAAASICARKRTACVGGNSLLFTRRFLVLKIVRVGRLKGREDARSNNCDANG